MSSTSKADQDPAEPRGQKEDPVETPLSQALRDYPELIQMFPDLPVNLVPPALPDQQAPQDQKDPKDPQGYQPIRPPGNHSRNPNLSRP